MQSKVADIWQRFLLTWTAQWRWNWFALAVVLSCTLAFTPRLSRRWQASLAQIAILIATLTFGVAYAWQLRWLGDDAFISFHYADNLARGLGLVFNPGERIEGYTNFLWTLLIALGIKLGLDPGQLAVVLGITCFALTVVITGALARRAAPAHDRLVLPIAAVLVAFNYSFVSFATSGLETMFAAFLLTSALERAVAHHSLAAGACAIGATMAHPDHAVLYAGLGAALFLARRSLRDLGWYLAPFALVFVPYYLWRWHYYGEFFPNTYYAKSGGDWYLEQGGVYLLICSLAAGLWAALPLGVVALVGRRPLVLTRYALLAVPAYLFYVAKVGGDFMLGRLVCSLIPVLAVLAEIGFYQLVRTPRWRPAGAALLVLASALAVRLDLIKPMEKAWHVADERTFYPLTSFSPITVGSIYFDWGNGLRRHVTPRSQAKPPLVAIASVGMIGYLSRLPLLDTFGLTDRTVAHTPIAHRGRPGHEKSASPGYVLSRDTAFGDDPIFPAPYDAWSTLTIEGTTYWLGSYDRALLDPLAGDPGVTFVAMPQVIDDYLSKPTAKTQDEAACDLWFFGEYYLRHNDDPERRARIANQMHSYGVLPPGTEDLLLPGGGPSRWERLQTLPWQPGQGEWIENGSAFGEWPSRGLQAGQGMAFPVSGPFINTFQPPEGDAATGRLQSPSQRLDGDVVLVKIGGGRDLDNLNVSLVVDGQTVARATGCNTELTGARVFDVREHHGKSGYILLTDSAAGGWGHLIVDEVSQWRRR
jgi:hypothetical protein